MTRAPGWRGVGTAGGGGFAKKRGYELDPRDFGVTFDEAGDTDDYAAWVRCIDAAASTRWPIVAPPGTSLVSAPLVLSDHVVLRGTPAGHSLEPLTCIKARSADGLRRAVLDVRARCQLADLSIHANSVARHAMAFRGDTARKVVERVLSQRALQDGVCVYAMAADGVTPSNHNASEWKVHSAWNNGRIHCSAPVAAEYAIYSSNVIAHALTATIGATVDGFTTVTIPGANLLPSDEQLLDADAIALHQGSPIRFGSGASAEYRYVYEVVDATTIVVPAVTLVGDQVFAVGAGDGYYEERHTDTNINRHWGGLYSRNAGVALAFDGLYGPEVHSIQITTQPFWGIRVATYGGFNVVYTTRIEHCYFEGIGRKPYLINGAQGIVITSGLDANVWTDPFDLGLGEIYAMGVFQQRDRFVQIGSFYVDCWTSKIKDATIEGRTLFSQRWMSPTGNPGYVLSLTGTTDPATDRIIIHELTEEVTLSGSPVFAHARSRELLITNSTHFPVMLEDMSVREASGLELKTPTVRLAQWDTLRLWNIQDVRWIEVERAVKPTCVRWTAPASGATITVGVPVVLSADAWCEAGTTATVASVAFYRNYACTLKIGDAVAGGGMAWSYTATLAPGDEALTILYVRATDNLGRHSAPVGLTVTVTV